MKYNFIQMQIEYNIFWLKKFINIIIFCSISNFSIF